MNSAQTAAAVAVGVVVIAGVLYFSGALSGTPATDGQGSSTPTTATETYSNAQYGISFTYPKRYFVVENEVGTAQRARHVVALFEDTQTNRDIISGKIQNTEGPIGIVVDILQNMEHQSAETWVKGSNDSNYKLGDGQLGSASVGGKSGVSYQWSGLYNSKSVAVATDSYIYAFHALYDAPTDITLQDFPTIVNSVQFK